MQLLNTLYVSAQGAYLARRGESVLVKVNGEKRLQVPIHTLESIVCIGRVSCSPPLMGLCGREGVTIAFLSRRGRFRARVEGPRSGNVLLRREQYRKADEESASLFLSRAMVQAKAANARTVLMRRLREVGEGNSQGMRSAVKRHARIVQLLDDACSLDEVRGLEGEAAQRYFECFDQLISSPEPAFGFTSRSRRPPLDPVNALLSFLYVLLAQDLVSAAESTGLDPAVGFLHRDRPGRPGLALDLMEELRPVWCDRLAVTLINRKQVAASDFERTATGAVLMEEKTRREVLVAYQKRKREEIHHPFLDKKIPWGLVPHIQARLLARHLRGDLDAYPAFLWR